MKNKKRLVRLAVLISFIFTIFSPLNGSAETYAVDRADGGVSIVNYFDGASKSLDQVLNDIGLHGRPFKKIANGDMPQTKQDRNFWKLLGSKVVVDAVKKQAHLDALAAKEAEKDAIYAKLKISREEFEKIKK